jgi:hypothetical protein
LAIDELAWIDAKAKPLVTANLIIP